MIPTKSQSARMSLGSFRFSAIGPGVRKMAPPDIVPTRRAAPPQVPSERRRSPAFAPCPCASAGPPWGVALISLPGDALDLDGDAAGERAGLDGRPGRIRRLEIGLVNL